MDIYHLYGTITHSTVLITNLTGLSGLYYTLIVQILSYVYKNG